MTFQTKESACDHCGRFEVLVNFDVTEADYKLWLCEDCNDELLEQFAKLDAQDDVTD